ncbi:MAG: NAD-dependent epimerase/dehydratase family protein [Chloroflexi bacterium]|nr:NAD-dependent epimerase/dehydratase family protein [Chloroflexota bacterium]
MKVLVTSATSEIGEIVSDALRAGNDLTLTDLPRVKRPPRGVKVHELGHDESTDALVRSHDVVVHIGYGTHKAEATPLLDYLTRCTYNLLTGCVNTGVKRFVYLHTLKVFQDYETHLTVTERWKSLPSTDPNILAAHLGEYVCKEFAREQPVDVVSLRLGFPLIKGARGAASRSKETAALASSDLALALQAALKVKLPKKWNPIHVQSPVPNARFLMGTAETVLAYPRKAAA